MQFGGEYLFAGSRVSRAPFYLDPRQPFTRPVALFVGDNNYETKRVYVFTFDSRIRGGDLFMGTRSEMSLFQILADLEVALRQNSLAAIKQSIVDLQDGRYRIERERVNYSNKMEHAQSAQISLAVELNSLVQIASVLK